MELREIMSQVQQRTNTARSLLNEGNHVLCKLELEILTGQLMMHFDVVNPEDLKDGVRDPGPEPPMTAAEPPTSDNVGEQIAEAMGVQKDETVDNVDQP